MMRERPIGVGFIGEISDFGLRIADWVSWFFDPQSEIRNPQLLSPVLRASRAAVDAVAVLERLDELLLQCVPFGTVDFDIERVPQEIVRAGVFVEAADEV